VRSDRRINLMLAALSTALTLGLVAVVGEIAARYREAHRDTVPGPASHFFYRHRRFGYAFVRDKRYYDWFSINAQGFRGARDTDVDAKGAFRILAVGASTTFDMFVSADEHAWPAVLEGVLTPPGSRRVEVLNAGVPGYVLWQNTQRFSAELAQYRPDLVLVLHGHNELGAMTRRAIGLTEPAQRPDRFRPATPWGEWLTDRSTLYRKVVAKWQAIRGERALRDLAAQATLTAEDWERVIERSAREYERDLETFIAVARVDSARLVLLEMVHVTHPEAADETDPVLRSAWQNAWPSAPVQVVLNTYRVFNEVTRRVAARHSIPLIPTTRFGIVGAGYYAPGDPIHFNDQGARRMAERMADELTRMGPLDPAATGVETADSVSGGG
jgi:lysophospholipase L1-like esterase